MSAGPHTLRVLDWVFQTADVSTAGLAARTGRRVRVDLAQTKDEPRESPATFEVPAVLRNEHGDWRLAASWIAGTIAADLGRAEIRRSDADARFTFATVAKTILALDVLARGGLVIHSVAIASAEGRAALFTGASGAGKSTLGTLCEGVAGLTRLSDELVVVLPEGEGFSAHATPWNLGSEREGRLAMMGTLVHAAGHRVEPCGASEVLRVLLKNVLLPDRSAQARASAFRSAARLVGTTPAVRLRFARDIGVADALKAALA